MGLRMKSFSIIGIHWKIQYLEGVHKKLVYREELPKKGIWTVGRCKRGLGEKDRSDVFEGGGGGAGGWYKNTHYALYSTCYFLFVFCIVAFGLSFTCHLLNILNHSYDVTRNRIC